MANFSIKPLQLGFKTCAVSSIAMSSVKPLVADQMISTCFFNVHWLVLRAVSKSQSDAGPARRSCAGWALSRSDPNWRKPLASSRYCARSRRQKSRRPAFIALIGPRRLRAITELPTLIAGRMPALNKSPSRKDLAVGDRNHVWSEYKPRCSPALRFK